MLAYMFGQKKLRTFFVDPDYPGKVLGMSTSISYVLIPLSLVLAGRAAEVWPAFVLPLVSGAVLIGVLGTLRKGEH